MKFSVITAACRPVEVLEKLVAQFLAQSCGEFEHIIVYDGRPPENVRNYFHTLNEQRVRFEWLPEHEGKYGTAPRNRGIELSRGEWIVFADDDDLYAPHYLEAFAELSLKQGELGLVRLNNYGTVVPRHSMKQFPRHTHVGTPCCAFEGDVLRNDSELRWRYDGNYDHDFQFVKEYCERVRPVVRLNERVVVKAGNRSLFEENKLVGKQLQWYLSWSEPNGFAELFNPQKSDRWLFRKLNALGRLFSSG